MAQILDSFATEFRILVSGTGKAKKEISALEQSINNSTKAMGRNVLLYGMALGLISKASAGIESDIIGIATQARISTDSMWDHYNVVKKVGSAYGVTGREMLKGFKEIVDLTGNADVALNNSSLLAKMIRGGKMDPIDAGALISVYDDLGVKNEEVMTDLVNQAVYLSKIGSVPIDKLSSIIPKMLSLYKVTGVEDLKKANREIVVMAQMANTVLRSPSKTGVAIEAMLLDLSNNVEKVNAAIGTSFTGDEGILTIIKAITEFYAMDTKGNKNLAASALGLDPSDLKDGKNFLSALSSFYGRRAIRAGVGIGTNVDRLDNALAGVDAIGDIVGEDSIQQSQSLTYEINRIIISLQGIIDTISESQALVPILKSFADILTLIADILSAIPAPILTIIISFLAWQFVMRGLVAVGMRPMVNTLQTKLLPLMTAMTFSTKTATGATVKLTWAQRAWNAAWLASPIGAALTVISLLIAAMGGLYALFRKAPDMPDLKMKGGIDIEKRINYAYSKSDLSKTPSLVGSSIARATNMREQNFTSNVYVDTVNGDDDIEALSGALEFEILQAQQRFA